MNLPRPLAVGRRAASRARHRSSTGRRRDCCQLVGCSAAGASHGYGARPAAQSAMAAWHISARLCVTVSYAMTPRAQISCAGDAMTVPPESAASATSGGAYASEQRARTCSPAAHARHECHARDDRTGICRLCRYARSDDLVLATQTQLLSTRSAHVCSRHAGTTCMQQRTRAGDNSQVQQPPLRAM
jgi:hypothetical protein